MKKKILTIAVAVAVLLIGGTLVLYKTVHSPFYTLKQLSNCINNHDWNGFEKYIDLSGFKQLNDVALKSMVESTGEPFGVVKILKDAANFSSEKKEIIPMGKLTVVRFWQKYSDYDVPAYTEIVFRSEGFFYVVASVSDDDIEPRVGIVSRLYSEYFEKPIKEEIEKSVKISVSKVYEGCSNWVLGTCFEPITMVERKIENLSDEAIKKIEYNFSVYGVIKFQADSALIKPKSTIVVGKKSGWRYNPFIEEDVALRNAKPEQFEINVSRIEFESGKSLDVYYRPDVKNYPPQEDVIAWGLQNHVFMTDSLDSWVKHYNSLK